MTISATTVVTRTSTNGTSHTFNFAYPFGDPDDLAVYLVNNTTFASTLQVRDTNYTVSNTGSEPESGGTITFINELSVATAPSSGQTVVILRDPALIQDFNPSGRYPAEQGEDALDRIYQIIQLNDWRIGRSIRQPDTEAAFTMELPVAATRAGKALIFDADGDVTVGATASDIATAAEASATAAAASAAAAAIDASDAEQAANDAAAAKTAAELAQAAAEAAQTAAETAETNAETAETNAETAAATATSEAGNASTSATLAQDWATKIDGQVAATDYASKAWAIGGTGVTDTASRGASKEWATKAEDSTVDGSGYSALHWSAKASAQRVLAETARTGAETAETNAETAQGLAEAARDAAQTAQTAAELAETHAETAETNAETAQTAAEAAQAYAEEWAVKAEDSPVSIAAGGDGSTTFSSLHWAAKAAASAASLTTEAIQDIAGAMFSGNTETLITVTYQDADGTIDLAVDSDLSHYSNATSDFQSGSQVSSSISSATANMLETGDIGVSVQGYSANLAEWSGINPSTDGGSLVAAADYAAMRGLLDLEAGTDFYSKTAADAAFQPLAANLTEWAGINPSANGGSLVAAADYAAMRGLLDLEAGTDFYSISAANAAFQAASATLTSLASSSANGVSLVTAANYAAMKALLDVESGTDFLSPAAIAAAYQPLDELLTEIAALNVAPGADRGIFYDHSGTAVDYFTATNGIEFSTTNLQMTSAQRTRSITVVIDGGGSTITTGIKGDFKVPVACTITGAYALADTSGSIVVDVWKDTQANFPPTDADTITASAPVTISTATNSSDTTLTGWTTSVAAGDVLRFNVDSVTSIARLTITLTVTVT